MNAPLFDELNIIFSYRCGKLLHTFNFSLFNEKYGKSN